MIYSQKKANWHVTPNLIEFQRFGRHWVKNYQNNFIQKSWILYKVFSEDCNVICKKSTGSNYKLCVIEMFGHFFFKRLRWVFVDICVYVRVCNYVLKCMIFHVQLSTILCEIYVLCEKHTLLFCSKQLCHHSQTSRFFEGLNFWYRGDSF